MLFGGNPRYENVPLIGRGSPPPSVCHGKTVSYTAAKLIITRSVFAEIMNGNQRVRASARLPPAGFSD